jgi:hypothetical protein
MQLTRIKFILNIQVKKIYSWQFQKLQELGKVQQHFPSKSGIQVPSAARLYHNLDD